MSFEWYQITYELSHNNYLWHIGLGTLGMVGGVVGEVYPHIFLVKNGILTNCLPYGNTKFCCFS